MRYKIKIILEYNGAKFHGWQKQGELRTVQSELSRVLPVILRQKISHIDASGRTDAGVHARAQVATFCVDEEIDLFRLRAAISSIFRGELSIVHAEYVPMEFHPRRNAISKQYLYKIMNRNVPPVFERGFVWHVPRPLDVESLRKSASQLLGTHDFTSFRAGDCSAPSAVKTILEIDITREGDLISIRITGKGFLKQMVRNIVGTLVGLEHKRLSVGSIREVLDAKDRRRAGVTAPAYGLCLEWVKYE